MLSTVNMANLKIMFIWKLKFAANANGIPNFQLQLHIHAAQSKI